MFISKDIPLWLCDSFGVVSSPGLHTTFQIKAQGLGQFCYASMPSCLFPPVITELEWKILPKEVAPFHYCIQCKIQSRSRGCQASLLGGKAKQNYISLFMLHLWYIHQCHAIISCTTNEYHVGGFHMLWWTHWLPWLSFWMSFAWLSSSAVTSRWRNDKKEVTTSKHVAHSSCFVRQAKDFLLHRQDVIRNKSFVPSS